MTADLADACAELAGLCPHLAGALQRDNGGEGGTRTWHGIQVVNADVLHARDTLRREVPVAIRAAAAWLNEHPPATMDASLRQIPRYVERLATLGRHEQAAAITTPVYRWLALTKRALGLRKPDTTLPYPCPWARDYPDNHPGREALILVGAEGFLRPHPGGGFRVQWVHGRGTYWPAPGCGADWNQAESRLLERILEMAAA